VSVFVFSQSTNVVYAVFPLLIWGALRFWQPGAAVGSLLVAAVAVAFTANGKGPFAVSGPDDRLLLAQTLVAVAALTAFVLAAVTSERRRAEDAEREIAETLQRSLLPAAAPSIAGWEIATLYRPAGSVEVQVGGDFYDFFATGAGWTVILGDVAGKGVEAAAMAALVRHGARFMSQADKPPAAVLAGLDDALRQQPRLSLCSALCMSVQSTHLLVSSAGHPGPLIVRQDGRIREIGGGGPMLGVPSGAAWPERTVPVGPEETVLLYTDGVTDARGETERFGQQRLAELLIEHASLSPGDLLAELESALDRFQRGPQSDDTAALALRLERSPVKGHMRSRSVAPRARAPARTTSPGFDIQSFVTAAVSTLKVAGEIDHLTADRVVEAFDHASRQDSAEVVLDLAAVAFVDSAGLRAVVEIERCARQQAVNLRIASPPEHVRAVFRLSGMEQLLPSIEGQVNGSLDVTYLERVVLELMVSDRAPGQARREVHEAIDGKLSESESEVAVLLTSELVTNAVLHPKHRDGGSIGLRISSDLGRIRVEVADSGHGFDPAELKRNDDAAGGRGLLLVARGAARWGTNRDGRFWVWFELAQSD
jgi:anti-anti-sigma factor